MSNVEQRVAAVELRLENAFALDSRLKSLEAEIQKTSKKSSFRDWLQALAPYVSGVVVALVGFMINDSVNHALQREQLDLEYVKDMRDLIKDFDEANSQSAADANAVGLAMYGQHAIIPLVERLEGGDVATLAAERGLRLVGNNAHEVACPKFAEVITDHARRFRWQTHKTMIKVIGQSSCVDVIASLQKYDQDLQATANDAKRLATFARRYSEVEGFDADSAASLRQELDDALEILKSQRRS